MAIFRGNIVAVADQIIQRRTGRFPDPKPANLKPPLQKQVGETVRLRLKSGR